MPPQSSCDSRDDEPNARHGAILQVLNQELEELLCTRFGASPAPETKALALRKALSERLRAGGVLLIDDLKLESARTKEIVGVLSALELKGSALIVSQAPDKNLTLASRNVPNVALTTSESLNTYDVLRPDKLVFTRGAFEQVEARLNKE